MSEIIVRPSVQEDVSYLAEHLRQSDINEIWASNHIKPQDALEQGIDGSIYCRTAENGNPICIWGIAPVYIVGDSATVWMLATDDLEKYKVKFIRESRKYINEMLEFYPMLFNYVDARNLKSIAWLKMCGATMLDAQPYGVEGLPFHYFFFERSK